VSLRYCFMTGLLAMAVLLTPRPLAYAQSATTYKVGSVVVSQPWSRATLNAARAGSGFLRLTNTGTVSDRLIGGTVAVAKSVEIHEMAMVDGVMQMRELPNGLEIKPGETVELKPGGHHMMFMDLTAPLKTGSTLKGELRFERAGTVAIEYVIEPAGARAPAKSPAQ
jgi:hypothetical protein